MKKTIIALFLLGAFSGSAQSILDQLDASGGLYRDRPDGGYHEKAQGSPYINETFAVSEIAGLVGNVRTRYNAERDEIEIQNDQSQIFVLNKKDNFAKISNTYGKYVLRLVNYKNTSGDPVYGYLVELTTLNGISLLKRDKIILQKERQGKSSYDTYTPAKFVKAADDFYIELKDKSIIALPKNKKKFLELFPDKKDAITAFLKNNDYSMNEADMTKIVRFVATL